MLYSSYWKKAEWLTKPGNYIVSEYFTGVDAIRNPSGNKNIKSSTFYNEKEVVEYVINYNYDADDDIIKEYVTNS